MGPCSPCSCPVGASPALAHPGPIPAVFCLPCGERWCGLSVGRAPETPPRRFGKIQSIRMLPGKRCAFINFKQKAAAEAAYEDMLVSTGPGGTHGPSWALRPPGLQQHRCVSLARTLTWREAGWCCSSSTPPTPRRAPGSAPRPAARGVPSLGGSCSQQTSTAHGERSQAPCGGTLPPCTLGPHPGAGPTGLQPQHHPAPRHPGSCPGEPAGARTPPGRAVAAGL